MKKRIATLNDGTKRFLDSIDFRGGKVVLYGEISEYRILSNGAITFRYYGRKFGTIGSKIIPRDMVEKIEETSVTKELLDDLFDQAYLSIIDAGHTILTGKRGGLSVKWDHSKFN